MRPVLAFVVVCVILGGLSLYMRQFETQQQISREWHVQQASGRFDVAITLTFDAGPDEFAFDPGEATALIVEFAGEELLSEKRPIAAGTPIVIEGVKGLVQGANEFYVRATPREINPQRVYAIRVRILRDGGPIADESLWSDPGTPAEGLIRIDLTNLGQATGAP